MCSDPKVTSLWMSLVQVVPIETIQMPKCLFFGDLNPAIIETIYTWIFQKISRHFFQMLAQYIYIYIHLLLFGSETRHFGELLTSTALHHQAIWEILSVLVEKHVYPPGIKHGVLENTSYL